MNLMNRFLNYRRTNPERVMITVEHAGKKVEIDVYSSEFMAMDIHREYRTLIQKIAGDFKAHEIHGN